MSDLTLTAEIHTLIYDGARVDAGTAQTLAVAVIQRVLAAVATDLMRAATDLRENIQPEDDGAARYIQAIEDVAHRITHVPLDAAARIAEEDDR